MVHSAPKFCLRFFFPKRQINPIGFAARGILPKPGSPARGASGGRLGRNDWREFFRAWEA